VRVSTVERFAQDRPLGAATSRDVAAGQQISDAQCAWCHGSAGTGGTGPDLRRSTLRHATNDLALVEIVRNGIPGTEMPSFAISQRRAPEAGAGVRSTQNPLNPQRRERSACSASSALYVVVQNPNLTLNCSARGWPLPPLSAVRIRKSGSR